MIFYRAQVPHFNATGSIIAKQCLLPELQTERDNI
jgi:hypothetical protein